MNAMTELPRYVSHKKVWAREIADVTGCTLTFVDGFASITVDPSMYARYTPTTGDFLVDYADGYQSFSPRKAFLDGYTLDGPEKAPDKHAGLPVAGYKPQSTDAVEAVNENKRTEERLLRACDELKNDHRVDQRWLAVARTHFEQGFMAMNRSIFRPGRVALPGDPA